MNITINGDARNCRDGITILECLISLNLRSEMIVVERNGNIVHKSDYSDVVIAHGDTLEIVQMMAGG